MTLVDNGSRNVSYNYGFYLQDEWALADNLTVNYGLRYDAFSAFDAENQLSPRVNAVVEAYRYHHHPCQLRPVLLRCPLNWCGEPGCEAMFDNTTAASGVCGPTDTPMGQS